MVWLVFATSLDSHCNRMFGVAAKMLLHNKVRSISTLLGITMAFFLSTAQVGLLVGSCNTISAIMWHANVDVWVMAKQNPAFDYGTPIPAQRLYRVQSVPGVGWAESMFMGWQLLRNADGRMTIVEMVGVDDGLVGTPWSMAENERSVLLEPDAVIVDKLHAAQMGISEIGDEVELSDHREVVTGSRKEFALLRPLHSYLSRLNPP